MDTCALCGASLGAGDKFCGDCGKRFCRACGQRWLALHLG